MHFFLEHDVISLGFVDYFCREKKQSRNSAIKVLDFALTNDEGAPLCNKFVEVLGLRTVFPLFMQPPKQHKKRGLTQAEAEGHFLLHLSIDWLIDFSLGRLIAVRHFFGSTYQAYFVTILVFLLFFF